MVQMAMTVSERECCTLGFRSERAVVRIDIPVTLLYAQLMAKLASSQSFGISRSTGACALLREEE